MEEITSSVEQEDQPLTPAGRLFLQPLMNQVINCALTIENPITNVHNFKAEVQNSILLQHPRFCSLLVRDSHGREHWRRTHIDVDRHLIIRHAPLISPSDEDTCLSNEDVVNDYLADLSYSSPLPTDKPLWEIHVLMAHNTAVFRVHHALGDGISLMSMLMSCCRRADDPTRPPEIVGLGGAGVEREWSTVRTLVGYVWFTMVFVFEFLMRLLWLKDRTTVVSGGCGVELWPRKLATARFKLDDMKAVKRAVAGSDMSSSRTRWGNKFGVVLLPVYYHKSSTSDPLQYVKRAKAMIDMKKLSLEAPFSYKVLNLIVAFFGAKLASIMNYRILRNTTFTISNIIGPREKVTLVGNAVKYIRVNSSSLPHAITMHMVSYAGVADMQILVAKDVIPDPKVLAKCFEDALVQMKNAAEAQDAGSKY